MSIFKFASLFLLLCSSVRGVIDFQYCHVYPGGDCLEISVSSSPSACFSLDTNTTGPVSTVIGLTKGVQYVVYTADNCTGRSSTHGNGVTHLSRPFVNNVHSVSIHVPIVPPFRPMGCYTDSADGRTLAALSDVSKSMSVESCQIFCSTNGYIYAGVEYGHECFCDYSIRHPGSLVNSTTCDMPCSGKKNEICGGDSHINIYWNGKSGPANPTSVGGGAFAYRGCYTDNDNKTRSLPMHFDIKGGATPETCARTCKANNFTIVGLEYGLECWCGNQLSSTSTRVADDSCRIACKSNPENWCGDQNQLSLWSTKVL